MSRIKVDALQGTSGSDTAITLSGANATIGGTLAVTGVHTIGNNAVVTSEGGAVTQNLVQGLAKLWVRYQSSAIQDSLNVSSVSDLGTVNDNIVISFTNNFDDKDHYCPIGQFRSNIDGPSANPGALRISVGTDTNNCTTAQLGGSIANAAANAMLNWNAGQATIHGDLA